MLRKRSVVAMSLYLDSMAFRLLVREFTRYIRVKLMQLLFYYATDYHKQRATNVSNRLRDTLAYQRLNGTIQRREPNKAIG